MATHRNLRRMLGLALMVTLLLASFAGVTAQDENVLVIGHAEATDSLDPARGFNQTTGYINRVTYDTLVTFPDDNTNSIEPLLATEWLVSEDGLEYTFTLREGVTFAGTGNPVTAEDVVFSIERLQNVLGNPSFLADNIESVVANDDGTVTFTLVTPRSSFLSELSNYAFSVTDSQAIIENGGTSAEDAAETDAAEDFLNSTSAGTGEYILEGWEQQDQTVLVKNPDYWGEEPYYDRVIIVNIPEAATQALALESGDVDMALDITADQVPSLQENPDVEVYLGPSLIVHFILMNNDPEIGGPMADPTVQLAVRHALDYEGYKALWGGITPGTNLVFGLPYAYGDDQAMERDLDRARELLAEAGYPDGFDITLSYPDFTFQGVNMNTNAQKIQADLAEVGINVDLNVGELQVSLEEYRNGDQGFAYWFWGPDIIDAVDLISFLPGGKVAFERANWPLEDAPEEIQELIAQAQVETDPAEREAIFGQLQDYLQENGRFAPFNQPALQVAFDANIEGFVWHPQWGLDVSLLTVSE